MNWFYNLLSRDTNVKAVGAMQEHVDAITAHEEEFKQKSDSDLQAMTALFKARIADGETLDGMRDEAFAVARETARRVLHQRHYDVQLMGGVVLHNGDIAEMRTGEGKTLTATLAVYLNALSGRGVHVVTVNDYLARRDAAWMGRVYAALGMTVGVIAQQAAFVYDSAVEDALRPVSRAEAYQADITYGTNNEFGFDYLRDNMVMRAEQMVQRPLHYAIIDEVDSILIDEARTPLIISAAAEEVSERYAQFARIVKALKENDHYNIDEKMRATALTEEGIHALESALGVDNLYAEGGITLVHHAEQALKAQALFHRDKNYVVKDGEVVIVDEFTGRLMQGRRYSEGLHQAIEAKEGVKVQRESETLATVTFQNYFRLYEKIAGMTGTAESEAEEFHKIYGLDVVVIPTNKPTVRDDRTDLIYKTEKDKFAAVTRSVKEIHATGQPVLIGTVSIEKNEQLSDCFTKAGIAHEMLNAKNHAQEATILAEAGRKGAVTLATNMAGRGVDIILGGSLPEDETHHADWEKAHEDVLELGGLFVIGTERHESRRIDNQLRGRAGRQGDAGGSQFYVSMGDDLMRIFGSDRMRGVMDKLGMPDDMPIEHKMLSRGLERAQQKVEGHNFDMRKHLLEYDDVLNKHRETIYKRRRTFLHATEARDIREQALALYSEEVEAVVGIHAAQEGEWNIREIIETLHTMMPVDPALDVKIEECGTDARATAETEAKARTSIIELIMQRVEAQYDEFAKNFPDTHALHEVVKNIVLRSVDILWVEHLDAMTRLRQGIGLRGYGQREPLIEYKREGFRMFQHLLETIRKEVVYSLFKVTEAVRVRSLLERQGVSLSAPIKKAGNGKQIIDTTATPTTPKIGRNEPCHCGATRPDGLPMKFKHCHGK